MGAAAGAPQVFLAVTLPAACLAAAAQQEPVGCFLKGWKFNSDVYLTDIDQPGKDFDSPSSCQRYCGETPDCGVFAFLERNRTCWLGRAVDFSSPQLGTVSTNAPGWIAGPVQCPALPSLCVEMPEADFPGAVLSDWQRVWATGVPPPNLQCWPKQWTRAIDASCLTWQPAGCSSLTNMAQCLSSRDGSTKVAENGLRIHGEPCVWCKGVACNSGSTAVCQPMDYLLRGEGKAFTTFTARSKYQVANCDVGTRQPQEPEALGCLTEAPNSCSSLRDMTSCLSSCDGQKDASFKNDNLYRQPCVWCAGGICHTQDLSLNATSLRQSAMCETFDVMFNGEGQLFNSAMTRIGLQVAGCNGATPQALTMPTLEAPVSPTGRPDPFVEKPISCGEEPEVLEDIAAGWPGTCLGLERRILLAGTTCAEDCMNNVECPSYQEIHPTTNVTECWQGLGHDCYGFQGDRNIVRAQRFLHGSYRVLKSLPGTQVLGLTQMFDASTLRENRTEAVRACRHMCVSYLRCQAWTYSTWDGCMTDMGNMTYPPTADTFLSNTRSASFVLDGAYIQRMCRGLLEQVEQYEVLHSTSTTATVPGVTNTSEGGAAAVAGGAAAVAGGAAAVAGGAAAVAGGAAAVAGGAAAVAVLTTTPFGTGPYTLAPNPLLSPSPSSSAQPTSPPAPGDQRSGQLAGVAPTLLPMPVGIFPDTVTQTATATGTVTTMTTTVTNTGTEASGWDFKSTLVGFVGFSLLACLLAGLCAVGYKVLRGRGESRRQGKKKLLVEEEDEEESGEEESEVWSATSSSRQHLNPTSMGPSGADLFMTPQKPQIPPQMVGQPPSMPSPYAPLPTMPCEAIGNPFGTGVQGSIPSGPSLQSAFPSDASGMALGQSSPGVHANILSDQFAYPTQPVGTPMFTVSLDRQFGGYVGIEVDYAVAGDAVIVSVVHPTGLMGQWNATCLPNRQVLPGDRIIEVNGFSNNTEAMMAQMRHHHTLNMVVVPGVMHQ